MMIILIFLQSNLLASGANDSEIYIWDLNNFNVPMTPGTKSQVKGFSRGSVPAALQTSGPWMDTRLVIGREVVLFC